MAQECRRCKQSPALSGDTYCLACSVWEAIGRELQSPWPKVQFRSVVTDILVAGGRQIRALRHLAASEVPSADPASSRIKEEEEARPSGGGRPALERKRSTRGGEEKETYRLLEAKPKAKAEKSEEVERRKRKWSEVPDHTHRPLGGERDHRRPPEPDEPPSSQAKRSFETGKEAPRSSRTEEKERRNFPWHKKPRRAGRKHQRLSRLATNPSTRVHRKLPPSFLEVRAEDIGKDSLYRY